MRAAPEAHTPRAELALVLALTAVFFLRAAALPAWDQPLGDAWNRYLRNAVVMQTGEWRDYLPWRGPVHAWLCLALLPLAGTLVRAAQLVSLLAGTAALPLAWALGRPLVGPRAAVLAVALLALSPDLALFARFSTPYALQGALLLGGALLGVRAARATTAPRELGAGVAAAVVLGAGIGTDLRIAAQAGALFLALATFRPRVLWVPVVACGIGLACNAWLPMELVPLSGQVALQHGLARATPGCGTGAALLADAFGDCGRNLLAHNLTRAAAALPGGYAGLVTVGLALIAGLVPPRGAGWRARLVLVAPCVVLAPSLLLIEEQHRYGVPVAGFLALLLGAGLQRARSRGLLIAGLAAAAVAWSLHSGSLWVRAWTPPGDQPRPGRLDAPDAASTLAARIRDEWVDGEPVVDCGDIDLDVRLYPLPVRREPTSPQRLSPPCARLLHEGGPGWLVVTQRFKGEAAASWSVVDAHPFVLLRGTGP